VVLRTGSPTIRVQTEQQQQQQRKLSCLKTQCHETRSSINTYKASCKHLRQKLKNSLSVLSKICMGTLTCAARKKSPIFFSSILVSALTKRSHCKTEISVTWGEKVLCSIQVFCLQAIHTRLQKPKRVAT
jgi:hypothetical protein